MRNIGHDPWDQIKEEIILLCVQWYLTERLSYSQLKGITPRCSLIGLLHGHSLAGFAI